MINTKVIEDLFAADFAFLQSLYNKINQVNEGDKALPVAQRRAGKQ